MISIMSDTIGKLFDDGALATCARDAFLFRQGDPVRFMYLVVEGQIDLERHARSGTPMTLQRASVGRVVAEASAYSATYHCDGIAAEESRARAIPVTEFRRRVDRDSHLAGVWAAGLAHALQAARTNAEIRSLRTVAERLDTWLADGHSLPPRGRLQSLAQILGVTREALYRELSKRDEQGRRLPG